MPILQGDLIQLTFVGRWQQQVIMLTTHYKCRTPPDGSMTTGLALSNLIDFVDPAGANSLGDVYIKCLPENYTLREIWAQKIYPAREVKIQRPVSYAGLWATADAETGNVDAVVTLRTTKAGRSQVGNKHIGPMPADGYTSGLISAAMVIAMTTLAEGLILSLSPATAGVYDPCIYHRGGDGAAAKSDLVASYAVQTTARVMRRRTVGLGI